MKTPFTSLLYCVTLLGILVGVTPALASNNVNGSILGTAIASDNPIEDVEVTIRSLDSNLSQTTSTSTTGAYRFSQLTPGRYELSITAKGFKSISLETDVLTGKATTVHFSLEAGDLEEVIVTGVRESIFDVSSVENSTILIGNEVDQLPVSHNIESVALLTPGTMSGDVAFGNLISFGGSSVAENVYYINGMNVTDFRKGLGGSSIPFEFYDQFQFKAGGFSAEYGRSTGGVLSGTTRRGKGGWSTRMGYTTYPEALRSYSPDIPHPTNTGEFVSLASVDKSYSSQYFISSGGPVFADRFYVHLIYQGRDNRFDNFSAHGRLHRSTSEDPFWGGKIDWILNDYHRIEVTVFSDLQTSVGSSYNWDRASGAVGSHRGDNFSDRGGENYITNYIGKLSDSLTLSILRGQNQYDRTNYSLVDDICPAAHDYRDGQNKHLGCWTNITPGSSFDNRKLERLDIEYSVGYRHLLRFGFDRETNVSKEIRRYSGPNGGQYYRYYTVEPGSTLGNGGVVPESVTTLVRYRELRRGGNFKTTAGAWYIEDLWSISRVFKVRLGLRNEGFNNRNGNGETFITIENQWAPRLGLVWDVHGNSQSRLFVNFGRYHLPIANNTNVRLAGAELYTQDWYTLGGPILENGSVVFGTKLGPTSYFGDGTVPPADQVIDTTVKPMYQDEFMVGYEAEISSGIIGSVTYTYRNLGRAIEDITIDQAIGLPGEFHYILTNPGTDVKTRFDLDGDGEAELISLRAEDLGFPNPVRKYHGLTFTFKKKWRRGTYIDATYTWAHSYGNYEGLVRSDNGQSDAGITTLFDFAGLMEGAYGDLPNDRRHSLKVFGLVSFLQRWQSSFSASYIHGRPKNAFGIHPTDSYAALYGSSSFYQQGTLVSRGSLGRTEGVFNIDIGIQFEPTLWSNQLQIKVDIFNVFDLDGVIEVREIADQSTGVPAPTFGLPAAFQRPRIVRLSFRYEIE